MAFRDLPSIFIERSRDVPLSHFRFSLKASFTGDFADVDVIVDDSLSEDFLSTKVP